MGFESFLGNREAVTAVRQMFSAHRVPGALLFSGPDGVGKKTLALMFAKALNCERRGPGEDDFCGECAPCRKAEEMLAATREDLARRRQIKDSARRVESLVYFDLQLIEPLTRFILIEQIRQLRNVAYTRPFEFKQRVFVIDEAQALHWQAVDLLLKILEEPPETTTLVLVCPNAYELRPTIRSRCRRIQFLPVEESVILDSLGEEPRLPKAQRLLASRIAAGSIVKARAFDARAFERRRQPWLNFLGVVSKGANSLNGSDWKLLFDSTKGLTENREEFQETLKTGYTLLRDLLQILEAAPESAVSNIDLLLRLKTLAPKLGLARIEQLANGLDQAYRLQTRNVNQQLGLDAMVAELAASGQPDSGA